MSVLPQAPYNVWGLLKMLGRLIPNTNVVKFVGYKVYYSTHLRNKLEQWQMIQTNKPHAVLQGLSSMATYYLKVSAFNSAGDGPLSDAFPIIVNPGDV
ncbi:hypothetical protein ACTXT7_010853 [Hymenolepis weldensis]